MLHDPHRQSPARPQELFAVLQRVPIFSRFTEEQLQRLARRTRIVCRVAGENLFRRGDEAKALYLLVTGQLKLYRESPGGDAVIIDLIEPGATFAESRLFLEHPHFHVSCAALVDSEVAVIDRSTLLSLLRESSETCLLLLRQLSERAERHVDDIERLALQGSTCRVAGYLLGQLPPGRNEYLLKVPKGVLAARLAIRAETLSRVLKQLAEQGSVSVSGQNIVHVHSREKLTRLALQAALGEQR